MPVHRFMFLLAASGCLVAAPLQAVDWVQAGANTNQPIWGLRGGLLWAIPPGGFPAPGGPRGLIRLGYPNLTEGHYQLINFIAIEPIVKGKRAFSELEFSKSDRVQGKRLWVIGSTTNADGPSAQVLDPGRLLQPAPGIEQLEVVLGVERFENGAHVRVLVTQRSDTPEEIRLKVYAEPDSTALDYCVLTATMGNKARTRLLWLKDEVVSSLKLYPELKTCDFAPTHLYALDRMARTVGQDVLVALTTDEENPAAVFPFPGKEWWHYGGCKLTQYWKKPQGTVHEDLQVAVNARHTYWQSNQPIPGGVAFENFELRERFYQGQAFIFGMTGKTPAELGLSTKPK